MELRRIRTEEAARLMQPFTYYYWITDDGVTAGAIRIVEKQDGSRRQISPLFILPKHRRKGLALAAIEAAEHSARRREPGAQHHPARAGKLPSLRKSRLSPDRRNPANQPEHDSRFLREKLNCKGASKL